eukprot:5803393-Pyramimonas_sp.AAC.1
MPRIGVRVVVAGHGVRGPCCGTSDTPRGIDHPFVKGPGRDSSDRGGNLTQLHPREGGRLPVGSHARRS